MYYFSNAPKKGKGLPAGRAEDFAQIKAKPWK